MKFKLSAVLFAYFIVFFFILGCQKDEGLQEFQTLEDTPHSIDHQNHSYGGLQLNFKNTALLSGEINSFVKRVQEVKLLKTTSRNEGANYTILTDHVLEFHTEGSDKTTYTFAVEQQDSLSTLVENIVVIQRGDSVHKAFKLTYPNLLSDEQSYSYYSPVDQNEEVIITPFDPVSLMSYFSRTCSGSYETVQIGVFCTNGGTTSTCGSPGNHTGEVSIIAFIETCDQIQDCTGCLSGGGGGFGSPNLGGGGSGGSGISGTAPVLSNQMKFENFKEELGRSTQSYLLNDLILNTKIYNLLSDHSFSSQIKSKVNAILETIAQPDSDLPQAGMGDLIDPSELTGLRVLDYIIAIPNIELEKAVLLVNLETLSDELLSEETVQWILENPLFAEEALEALENGGAVDFEERIIYNENLNTKPCHKKIIEDAIGISSPLTNLINATFQTNSESNLTLDVSNSITSNAETFPTFAYDVTTRTCDIRIKFRESYLDSTTDISLARTTIHESLHAVLIYMHEDGHLVNDNGTTIDGYGNLVQAYNNYRAHLPINLNVSHHELMADFISSIATSLAFYGTQIGLNEPFSFYRKLSWAGLTETLTFNTLYPKYLEPSDEIDNPNNVNIEWLNIINTIASEQNDASYTFNHSNGNTYYYQAKGTPINTTEPCN